MDLHAFKKTPKVAPLLVQLYEGQQRYDVADEKNPALRAALTKAVTDLLDIPLSTNEEELLTDVLIGLTRQAELDLRQALADRLAALPSVPLRLVLHLVNDDISVAAPVLKKSPILSDLDLIYIIKSQGSEYARAIAERSFLGSQVVDALIDAGDVETTVILTKNERVQLTQHAVEVLCEMAKIHDDIVKPLLRRSEIPENFARELYVHVGQELKSYMRTFHGISEDDLDETIDDLVVEFAEEPASEFMPSTRMMRAADKFAVRGMLNVNLMLETLNRGQIRSFIAMFSRFTGVNAERIEEFLKQPCPKGMAIACRAFDIQKSDFSRIFLLTNRMRSDGRLVNHRKMIETLRYFDSVRPAVAKRIIARRAR